ncbi:MAG: hypothetical protein GY847_16305 [Proteobacteria bacterium]|nr:hypothetical protein [Pseudomonadota bacterium]
MKQGFSNATWGFIQNRTAEIRKLVLEIIPSFESLRYHREVAVALDLLRSAINKDEFPRVILQKI